MPIFAGVLHNDAMTKVISKRKQNGEVFTPADLANFLASRMAAYINYNKTLKVCDPACGDGALLYAISNKLSAHHQNISITGYDKDCEYLRNAKELIISSYPNIESSFELKDFIESPAENSLFTSFVKFDAIIGNPPYVRTQALGNEKAQIIAKQYGLSGKVDLYFPFLINMTECLNEGGILGVITSNRYLTTKSGESIRKYLLEHYDVLEIIDLGDTKLFDAAVLPAIFIGRKNESAKKNTGGKFYKIYENLTGEPPVMSKQNIYDVLNSEESGCYQVGKSSYMYSVGTFIMPITNTAIWHMNTNQEQRWVDTIKANTCFYVGDRFGVKVGVKSCADEVFLEPSYYTASDRPEEVFFRDMISQENISPWIISDKLSKVIYPHFDDNGEKSVLKLDEYPKAASFFAKHEMRLKSRSYLMKSNRLWYEYWVPQNATLWKYPKLIFPDISAEPRFAIDKSGAIVNGNCYWIYASNEEDLNLLYLIAGVANSNLMIKYHDLCFNNKLYNGRRRYLSQYIEKYPVPDPNTIYAHKIIDIVKRLHSHVEDSEYNYLLSALNENVNLAFQSSLSS